MGTEGNTGTAGDAARPVQIGDVIWEPPSDVMETTRFGAYVRWLEAERDLHFADFTAMWQWSVDDLDAFWRTIWDYFEVESATPVETVLADATMPGAKWFPGVGINFAGEAIRNIKDRPDDLALIGVSQTRDDVELTNAEFLALVGRIQAGLKARGIQKGDRVVACMPNVPETVAAWFACAGLGVIWASAAPEFGPQAVIDRFGQLEPRLLLTVDGYRYGDKDIDTRDRIEAVRAALPTLEEVIAMPFNGRDVPDSTPWSDFTAVSAEPEAIPVPFDHPLCVLFSSGTTGLPKPIVHGHGGIILETYKSLGLRWDLGIGDRLMFFSTTAWMMWNATVASLMCGNTVVCLDGNPMYPDQSAQWRLAEKVGTTVLGLGPPYVTACAKAGMEPRNEFDLSAVRLLVSGGAPMPAESHVWITEHFAGQAPLILGSGGTDVCTGIVEGSPLTPMYAGEMSAKGLGVAVYAFDEDGNSVVDELGEMVITKPMPSMPVSFWGDDDGSRIKAAYFEHYPGLMRFGDWIRFTPHNSSLITGRSDATLNRGGVRIGTAEIYRVVDFMDEVDDSLIIHLEDPDGGMGELVLFVVPQSGPLGDELRAAIVTELRTKLSPRHAPNTIYEIPEVPRNMTRKKLELPIKKILLGAKVDDVMSRQAMINPDSLGAIPCVGGGARMTTSTVSRVAIVGTGVIGASWSALFLARGLEVACTDPDPGAADRLAATIDSWWPSLDRQGLVIDGADPARWSFVADAATAVEGADFVQENGPERIEVKHDLYREMDAVAGPDVVLASSTSGLMASDIQQACERHPERVVIGHPFNPPHLVPLVEVVGGRATSDAAIESAMAFYAAAGKSPIRINTELPGHVTNRLQAALWREAYWLVEQGACSVADIDKAISSGPGLRWALLGPFATQHVSGGPGGIAHVLEHLGPPMVDWWQTAQTAEWTDSLKTAVVAGVDDELAGIDQTAMLDERDRLLEQLIVAKSAANNLPGRAEGANL